LPGGPILLLHGQPGSARDWDPVMAALGADAGAIAIDRPGWDGHTPPADLPGNAEAALAALDCAGADDGATVVGHSLGAAVAAWLAVAHPDRVRALMLVAPAANTEALEPVDRLLAAPVLGELAAAVGLGSIGLALAAPPLRRLMTRMLALDERYLVSVGRGSLAPATWRAFASDQRAMVSELPALTARLGEISAPATIVIGTADRSVPVAASRVLSRQIRGARLVELEHRGHLLPQRNAGQLAELIRSASAP
jgi:pimeloyl-ACP methyl ester carboxylesterase